MIKTLKCLPISLFFLAGILLFAGCIKDALPNIEADILSVEYKETDFFAAPVITNDEVKLYANEDKVDLKAYAFNFTMSRGATSIPASGTVQDFTNPVIYTVTSENGAFSKQYTVTMTDEKVAFIPLYFDFETYNIDQYYKYTEFYDVVQERRVDTWDSGNSGFVLSISPLVKKKASLYPMQFTNEAHAGETAALLETKSTGTFGAAAKKPIAAGNIFLGEFDSGNVMGDPLLSTHFGRPIAAAPTTFSGFYHYTPAQKVIDQNSNVLANVKDSCSIVAVLYDSEELYSRTKLDHLNGTNLLTDPSIVATAYLYDGNTTSSKTYKEFNIPFKYLKDKPQEDSFNAGRYRLAIVLSSSKSGDSFIGAVGSVLLVDDLKIHTND